MEKLYTFYCRVFVCLFNAFLTATFHKMLKPPYFLVKRILNFNIVLDDASRPVKSVPIDIGLNIMFWGVFHEF